MTPHWSTTTQLTRPRIDRCTSRFMEKRVHLAPRQTGMPTRGSTKFQTTSCQSTLRRTSPNKTKKTGDDTIIAVPLAEGTQLPELSAL